MVCEKRITLVLLFILDAALERFQKTLSLCKLPALLVALWFCDPQYKRFKFLHETTLKSQIDTEIIPEPFVSIPQMLIEASTEV